MGIRRWVLPDTRAGAGDDAEVSTGCPGLAGRVLAARGITDAAEAAAFLSGGTLAPPWELAGMEEATQRLRQALEEGERIAVYGDYDCDGVTATVLLMSWLQDVGADVVRYVPERESEGYGMNMGAVDALADLGVDLIVTVDNGISAHEEIRYAGTLGMDVIVTDHHTPRETLPPAVAVVNPHRADCPSAYKELAGVGVVFKLICAMEEDDGTELLEVCSDLVALGTIADVVPLTGENRILVRHGLGCLAESQRPGIHSLIAVSGLAERDLTAESVAFGLAPRINAAGRMGLADLAIELLLTDDVQTADALAAKINENNTQRRGVEDAIMREVQSMIEADPAVLRRRILMLAGKGWHHGVVGIVAARLMERYGMPTLLFSLDGEEARASGRSIAGFSLIGAITACSEHLTRFGGHPLAAGLTLPADRLDDFIERMEAYARERYPVMPVAEIPVDCVLSPGELTVEALAPLATLEPFGAGNEAPLFMLRELRIEGLYPTADKKHLRIRLQGENHMFYAIRFRQTQESFAYRAGDVVDVVVSAGVSRWNGSDRLSVRIEDMRLSGRDQEAMIVSDGRYRMHRRGEYGDGGERGEILPQREDFAGVYRFLRRSGGYRFGREELWFRMAGTVDYCRMCIAMDVLEEMGLIYRREDGGTGVVSDAEKVDLSQSAILAALGT